MEISKLNSVMCAVLVCCFASANAQSSKAVAAAPILSPTPAPAPAPDYVNLTELLSVAGPFHTFLNYLVSTKVIDTFQNQANNTEEGITLFVPKDQGFSSLKKQTSLSNLTQDQLKSLFLFHALPHYYSLSDFKNLSGHPVPTFAGGAYSLNLTDNAGTVHINSGWTSTKVISAVHATDPVAIYETDRVLMPEAIFGTDIPPTPAPAPAPEIAPAADTPAGREKSDSASTTSAPSSSTRIIFNFGHLMSAIVGGVLFLIW